MVVFKAIGSKRSSLQRGHSDHQGNPGAVILGGGCAGGRHRNASSSRRCSGSGWVVRDKSSERPSVVGIGTSTIWGLQAFVWVKGVLGLHQAPPQASMIPHCVTLNYTKSSWDYRRRGELRQWRYKLPQAIRGFKRDDLARGLAARRSAQRS